MKNLPTRRRRRIIKATISVLLLALLLCAPTLSTRIRSAPMAAASDVAASESIDSSAAAVANSLFPAGSESNSPAAASSRGTVSEGAFELDSVLFSPRANASESDAFTGGPVFAAHSSVPLDSFNGRGNSANGHGGRNGGGIGSGSGGGGGGGGASHGNGNGNLSGGPDGNGQPPGSIFTFSPPSDRGSSDHPNSSSGNPDQQPQGPSADDLPSLTTTLFEFPPDGFVPPGGNDGRADITPVPEPATYGLIGASLLVVIMLRRRFQASKQA